MIFKEVLKPFAKPQFVDSVENPTVLALDSTEEGDTAVEQAPDPQDKNTVPFDATSYIQEVEKAIKQANDILTQNAPLVTTLSSSLSNLKKKIISMDFIKESIENFNKLGDLGVSMRYITSLLAFGAELSKENDVNAQIQLLKTNQEALTKQKDEIVTFESKINDLNMISDDGTEDVELISSEPILDFFSKVSKLFA